MFRLAIDPGKKCIGWCVGNGDRVIAAGVAQSKAIDVNGIVWDAFAVIPQHTYSEVIVEKMHVYDVQNQRGDQNDLIDLSLVGAQLAGLFRTHARYVIPSVWKGQLPKDVSHRRIEAKLAPAEKSVLATLPKTKIRHNAMDAIGIFLWSVGRFVR